MAAGKATATEKWDMAEPRNQPKAPRRAPGHDPEHDSTVKHAQNRSKQRSKNWETFQQGVLIFLLCLNDATVVLKKQKKCAEKTLQMHPITKVVLGDETIDFAALVEKSATEILRRDSSDQRQRRFERNKVTIAFNELLKVVRRLGYDVLEKKTRKSEKTIRMTKFKGVVLRSVQIIGEAKIEQIGTNVNTFIAEHFEEGTCVCGNAMLSQLRIPRRELTSIPRAVAQPAPAAHPAPPDAVPAPPAAPAHPQCPSEPPPGAFDEPTVPPFSAAHDPVPEDVPVLGSLNVDDEIRTSRDINDSFYSPNDFNQRLLVFQ